MPNFLQTITGIIGGNAVPPSPAPLVGNLPWGADNSNVASPFFYQMSPDGSLWDKLCNYRLLVIDSTNNTVVGGNNPSAVQINPLGSGTLIFEPLSSQWEFFLPITPQQLSITDAFSISTSATLRGILEEHSGVRFKNIVVAGTFGVWPGRPSVVNPPGTPNVLQSVFGGTIAAAQNVATQFTSIINNITNGSNSSKPVTVRPGSTDDLENGLGTGYYQTVMLQQFLEQYAEAKRNPANASWRLVFDIPKQNQSFVVTPLNFTWNENVNRPMEINYNLQLKAWRRINIKEIPAPPPNSVTPLSPGTLQTILNTISAAQNTAAASVNLIGSVRSDVDNILNVIRQTGLFVKGLAGVALAVADLPAQLTKDLGSTITNFLSTVNPNNLFGPAATNSIVADYIAAAKSLSQMNEGLSTTAVNNGQLGPSAAVSVTLNPLNNAFNNPLQNPLLFSIIPVNSLILNSQQKNALQNEVNDVNNFSVQDLKNMRATILQLCLQLSNSFGSGDSYYSTLFNTPQPPANTQPIDLDQYGILQSFYELLFSYDTLTATSQLDDQQILNSMQYVNALAATSNIEFAIPNSKIQVPVPFGLNIEQIAYRYLGDPQRWLEIATLNNLREPYIDQSGFQYPLLSNASGRSIVVGSSDDLFIGQTVYLFSNNQSPTARSILNITMLSATSFLITLDGLANLDIYTTAQQAYLKAYLPGTTNSQNVIWIPSDQPATPYDQISIPESVANVDLVGLSKVDFLLTTAGDLAIDNSGSWQLAAGYNNLVQALWLKFSTPLGSSILNPNFGLPVRPGIMVSDTSAGDIYNSIVRMITSDPRFSGIQGLQVSLTPPSVIINAGVQLAGVKGIYPVSFQLPTSS